MFLIIKSAYVSFQLPASSAALLSSPNDRIISTYVSRDETVTLVLPHVLTSL